MKNSNPKIVKVYDFDTKTFTTIPAAELATGMIQASVDGQQCWIDPKQTKASTFKGPFFHPPFEKSFRGKFRRLHGVFKEVYPISLKEWEDGFRRDMHPLPQIEAWLYRAGVFEEILGRHDLDLDQKKELFGVILQCATSPHENIGNVVSVEKLPKEIMHEAIQDFYGEPELKKQAARKPAIEYPDPAGNAPRPVEELMEPAKRELLKGAELIFGIDSFIGETTVFYGRERLKQIADGNEGAEVRMLSYLYDSRTNQLEMLAAAVELVKGRCEYSDRNHGK